MRDLHGYATIPFDAPNISISELMHFASDHMERVVANPQPALTVRLASTTTAYNAVVDAFGGDETKLGQRKGRNLAKANFRATLAAAVGKIAVKVEEAFGEKSPQFVECFPRGRKVFSDCPDDKLEGELQPVVDGVTAYQTQVGDQTVTDATTLLTNWNAVYATSKTATGNKTASQEAKRTARANLQLELYLNLLAVLQLFPRQPAKVDLYMQQSLLGPHTPAPPAPPAPPASSIQLGIHDSPAQLLISVTGTAPASLVVESSPDESNWSDLVTIDGNADTWAISNTSLYYRARGVDANGVTVIGESNSVLMSRDS